MGGGSMLSRVGYCKAMASGFRSSKSEFWFITHFLWGLKTTWRGVREYVPSWLVGWWWVFSSCRVVLQWWKCLLHAGKVAKCNRWCYRGWNEELRDVEWISCLLYGVTSSNGGYSPAESWVDSAYITCQVGRSFPLESFWTEYIIILLLCWPHGLLSL